MGLFYHVFHSACGEVQHLYGQPSRRDTNERHTYGHLIRRSSRVAMALGLYRSDLSGLTVIVELLRQPPLWCATHRLLLSAMCNRDDSDWPIHSLVGIARFSSAATTFHLFTRSMHCHIQRDRVSVNLFHSYSHIGCCNKNLT